MLIFADVVNKANQVIAAINDHDKPKNAKVEVAYKTRYHAVVLTLNNREAADWLRSCDIEMAFTEAFAEGSHIREHCYNLIAPRVPITFDPSNEQHLREVEEANNLDKGVIHKAKWIKPIRKRCLDQTHAYTILTSSSIDATNHLIRDGLCICNVLIRPTKQKQEPIQCMKCRQWGHFAKDCQEENDTCGTCEGKHCSNACTSRDKAYCVSCKVDTHPSSDRTCLEFMHRCAIVDERNLENRMPYFPTEQDWTMTMRP